MRQDDDDPVELPSNYSWRSIREAIRAEAFLLGFLAVWAVSVAVAMLFFPELRTPEGFGIATIGAGLVMFRIVLRRAMRG